MVAEYDICEDCDNLINKEMFPIISSRFKVCKNCKVFCENCNDEYRYPEKQCKNCGYNDYFVDIKKMGVTKRMVKETNNRDNYDENVGWTDGINSVNQTKNHIFINITPKHSHMMNYLDVYNGYKYEYIRHYIKEKPYEYKMNLFRKELKSLKVENDKLKKIISILMK